MLKFIQVVNLSILGSLTLLAQAQVTIYETDFSAGLGAFSSSGSVSTGSFGARMRSTFSGNGSIVSTPIDVSGFENLQLTLERSTLRLTTGESGDALYAADGGSFQLLESAQNPSGQVQFALPDADTVTLRFALNSFGTFRRYDVTNVVLTGAPIGSDPLLCDGLVDVEAAVLSNGYGYNLENTRNQVSSIDASNVADLTTRFAMTHAGVTSMRGASGVTTQAVFYYAGKKLIAADLSSGCEYWSYQSNADFRSSSVLLVPGMSMVFVGDNAGVVHAVNMETGALEWSQFAGTNVDAHRITGGMQYHDGVVYVPVASAEVIERIAWPCCITHGMLRAYAADTGAEIWTYHTTAEPTYEFYYQGPSGVSVWSTPTVDVASNTIYFGTGQNFSRPATNTSDAIIALNMATGEEKWIFQARTEDIWNAYTLAALTGSDFDFGASPILVENGSRLIAGDKAGFVYSLDTTDGSVDWVRRIGSGGTLGGVHWNMAVDNQRVYVAIADVSSSKVNPDITIDGEARPGIYALDLQTGDIEWEVHPDHVYAGEEYPSLYSAAVSVANDVVFAASLNGVVKAFNSDTGNELWSFDSAISVVGVDGTSGNGGTIDSVGVVVAGDHIIINSGYNNFGGQNAYQAGPGNAVFVLAPPLP